MRDSAEFAAGADAYRCGAPRACPIPHPNTEPGSTESTAWAAATHQWYRGYDLTNLGVL
jgi:hypothetical protein